MQQSQNFSLFLRPGGRFQITPLYDVLSAEPAFAAGHLARNQFRLSMAAGKSRHYRIGDIHPRHFAETAKAGGMPDADIEFCFYYLAETPDSALDAVAEALPQDVSPALADTVLTAVKHRLKAVREMAEKFG